jgi:hypothetical protein
MAYVQDPHGHVDITAGVLPRTKKLLDLMAKEKNVSRSAMINAILKKYTEKYAENQHKRSGAISE